jgi:2-polyprenyl-3-methyl-5-hydroxy-6-metoxy-1,4-benzoquinol methylase
VSAERLVRDHFDADALRFDAIYGEDKGLFARFVDNVWRGVVRRRLELTLQQLGPLAGKSVLDVGCGSGRYCLAYAERGAAHVVGVDFAARMIDLAKEHARDLKLDDRCEFRVGTFPEAVQDGTFDATTALGVFDYVERPGPVIARMWEQTRSTMVMSFPKRWEWRVPLRRLRFLFLGCPLFLYSEGDVRKLLREAGVDRYDWISLDRDYLIVARR